MSFQVSKLEIPEVLAIDLTSYGDDRGFFVETFRVNELAEIGLPPFVQDNHSRSTRGVLRGLHFQVAPHEMGKLVRCAHGEIFDVAVDIRPDSPTYRNWIGAKLSDSNHRMLYVPPGFAHGFCTLSDVADVIYKCTAYYVPEADRALAWDDPEIGIEWPIDEPILSDRDARAERLSEALK